MDTYYHWAILEREIAENMSPDANDPAAMQEAVAEQWAKYEDVAIKGIDRCGASRIFCYYAAYGASREAKGKERAGSFAYAEGAYMRSIDRFKQALSAPVSDVATVPIGAIYRGLALAYGSVGDVDRVIQTLKSWRASSGSDDFFKAGCRRLQEAHPFLRNNPQLAAMLVTAGYGAHPNAESRSGFAKGTGDH